MKRITAILAVVALFIISARGQGFLNLNFESAQNLPGSLTNNSAYVAVTNAMPHWTVYSGPADEGDVLSDIYYVSNYLSGSQSPVELEGGTLALSGNYSVELFGDCAIGQTATVPDDAASLEFEAGGAGGESGLGSGGVSVGGGSLSVTLGTDTLLLSAVSEGPDYTVYGANIPSDLDGLSEALIFSCQGSGSGQVVLDNIEFLPIPEPSECALMGVGAVALLVRRRRC